MTALYEGVVGQERAVAALQAAAASPVHAYLLVGPPGSGKRTAARSFAAALLCENGGCGECDACRRALAGTHPDVVTVEREGASIDVRQARRITALASMSPVEGKRKVLLLTDFHLVEEAAPALLKTIEEPPGPTVFVVMAEHVPADLVTIASRAVRVDFGPVPIEQIVAALVAGGVDPAVASEAAAASAGRLDRARLLASDPGFAERRGAWLEAPARLDGTGAAVAVLAAELLAAIDSVLEPLKERQVAEAASWPGSRTELEARHKREQRRVRTDELRFGLATLAEAYRDRLAAAAGPAARQALAALDAVAAANEALARNPNEPLLLQNLLLHLEL